MMDTFEKIERRNERRLERERHLREIDAISKCMTGGSNTSNDVSGESRYKTSWDELVQEEDEDEEIGHHYSGTKSNIHGVGVNGRGRGGGNDDSDDEDEYDDVSVSSGISWGGGVAWPKKTKESKKAVSSVAQQQQQQQSPPSLSALASSPSTRSLYRSSQRVLKEKSSRRSTKQEKKRRKAAIAASRSATAAAVASGRGGGRMAQSDMGAGGGQYDSSRVIQVNLRHLAPDPYDDGIAEELSRTKNMHHHHHQHHDGSDAENGTVLHRMFDRIVIRSTNCFHDGRDLTFRLWDDTVTKMRKDPSSSSASSPNRLGRFWVFLLVTSLLLIAIVASATLKGNSQKSKHIEHGDIDKASLEALGGPTRESGPGAEFEKDDGSDSSSHEMQAQEMQAQEMQAQEIQAQEMEPEVQGQEMEPEVQAQETEPEVQAQEMEPPEIQIKEAENLPPDALLPEINQEKSPSQIIIDGHLSDWENITPHYIAHDPKHDVTKNPDANIDITEIHVSNDDTYLYIAYKNHGPVQLNWGWKLLLDTDLEDEKDGQNGLVIRDGFGANFMLEAEYFFKHDPTAEEGAKPWKEIGSVSEWKVKDNVFELKFPLAWLDLPGDDYSSNVFNFVFIGIQTAIKGGSGDPNQEERVCFDEPDGYCTYDLA